MFSSLFFLSSGLFLGWSLGANDAANVFGTAVGSKMIRFRTAAFLCSVSLILGATLSGAGASDTLGKLGSVNAAAGAFTVAFSAALSVFFMTRSGLPVSTSQAIVGAIIGWNIYSGFSTDINVLVSIVSTWVVCPVLAAGFALVFYYILKFVLKKTKIHLIRLDNYTRIGLICVGIFGSYSLGANNIANVVGVFVKVSPFRDVIFFDTIKITSVQQLFFAGAVSIAVGVYTYSENVMKTVGNKVFKLSPLGSLVVVLASSAVLFVFASQGLSTFLLSLGLPAVPLVPVSSSQAVIGAVIGIGAVKSRENLNLKILGKISTGWILTPVIAGLFTFVLLFVVQNVFMQQVFITQK